MGVGVEEILGGGAGLVLASALPGWVIKTEAVTMTQKFTRIAVGALGAVAAGYVVDAVAGKRAAKAAIIGGLGGVAITTVNTLAPGTLGSGPAPTQRALTSGIPISRGRVATKAPGFETIRLY